MLLPKTRGIPTISALVLSALVLGAVPASAKPQAVVVEPVKDFEVVAKGEHLKHAFEIRNEGDEVLEITEVRPSCGCTVAKFDQKIAPGKSGFVIADVDTASLDGVIAKSVAVFTNDADNAKLQLTVKADVRPYIAVDPGYARFSYVQGEPTGTISETIYAPDGSDIEILEVKVPYDHIRVSHRVAGEEERDARGSGKQWKVDIEILPDAPVGPLRDHVEVIVDHPKQKKVLIPISGFVRPRQHVTPQEIDFGQVKSSDLPLVKGFTLTSFTTKGIDPPEVESSIKGLDIQVRKTGTTGHRYQVILQMTRDMPKGEFADVLRIRTSDEKSPVIEVPLRGVVL